MTGWISLHRKIQDHWVWEDKPFDRRSAWIDLIMMANHKDNKFVLGNELEKVERGSFITSEVKLSERWGWSRTKVRSFLKLLEEDEMLIKKSDNKKTYLTIVNYNDYQLLGTADDTAKEHRKDIGKTSKKHQKNTNNNDNNDNNENNDNKNTIFSFYENNGFGLLNKTSADYLIDLENEYSNKWLLEAMEEAVKSNARNLNYVKAILKNWKAKGKGNYKGGVSSGGETKRDNEEDRDGDFLSKVQERLRQQGSL